MNIIPKTNKFKINFAKENLITYFGVIFVFAVNAQTIDFDNAEKMKNAMKSRIVE